MKPEQKIFLESLSKVGIVDTNSILDKFLKKYPEVNASDALKYISEWQSTKYQILNESL